MQNLVDFGQVLVNFGKFVNNSILKTFNSILYISSEKDSLDFYCFQK